VVSRVLYGDLRTGRIIGELPCTAAAWSLTTNGPGSVDQVHVTGDVVARLQLRSSMPAARSFLAFEEDDRIREAGPLWARSWSWQTQTLTLGAAGLWSLFDHRKVLPVLTAGQRVQDASTVVSGTDLGGIARTVVAQALGHVGGNLPLVLPPLLAGTRTETFPGWKQLWLGAQLREFTTRDTGAPDIRFPARRTAADPRYIEWVMQVGTESAPLLSQAGADWVLDATSPKTPVIGIDEDEDATAMGERAWVTGNGTENQTLISSATDSTLLSLGWPLMELDESHSSVEVQATLDGHAANLVARSARPVAAWKVTARRHRVDQVQPGDYVQLVTKGDPWLPDGTRRMRVATMSGALDSDEVKMSMYPLQAVL
jgi:hypothetical protein